jgi:mRNA interferase MazF
MKRGEIYWCDLEPRRGHEQGSRRPVVIVSADAYNLSRSPLVGVLPMTTASSKNPIHVLLTAAETGLETDSTVLIDHARFLDRVRLHSEPSGQLSQGAMAKLDRNLARVLGL